MHKYINSRRSFIIYSIIYSFFALFFVIYFYILFYQIIYFLLNYMALPASKKHIVSYFLSGFLALLYFVGEVCMVKQCGHFDSFCVVVSFIFLHWKTHSFIVSKRSSSVNVYFYVFLRLFNC